MIAVPVRMISVARSVAVVGVVPALPGIVAVIGEEFLPGVRLAVRSNPTRFGGISGGLRSAGSRHGAPAVEEEVTHKNAEAWEPNRGSHVTF